MDVEVGLHHTSPPSGYTICEHSGTLINVFQVLGSPVETLAFLGASVEYATEAFFTVGMEPFALNKRSLTWNLFVAAFLAEETKVSTATKPSESPCRFTEWRSIVE